jgi:hypothetical protein
VSEAKEVGVTIPAVPDRTEAADRYFTYIDQVGRVDICEFLREQSSEALPVLTGISEEGSLTRYAEGKWSIRQVLAHIDDTERAFVFRALCFARGFGDALPGFNPDIAVPGANADGRSWQSHVAEFEAVRNATLAFFENLTPDRWDCRGVAGGNEFTVRAMAHITAGHAGHHVRILRERYLPLLAPQ